MKKKSSGQTFPQIPLYLLCLYSISSHERRSQGIDVIEKFESTNRPCGLAEYGGLQNMKKVVFQKSRTPAQIGKGVKKLYRDYSNFYTIK